MGKDLEAITADLGLVFQNKAMMKFEYWMDLYNAIFTYEDNSKFSICSDDCRVMIFD